MSISTILNIASSGLTAAQKQLSVVSDNVANVNTPGYIRKVAEQQSLNTQGVGSGVEVARIRLATDRFLQSASLNAGAEASRQGVRYELYDRIQSLFGDPGGDAGFFSQIDGVFSTFAASAEDAVSGPRRQQALFQTQALFDEAGRIASQIQATREDADGRLQTAVERTNDILKQIEALNVEIARSTVIDADASGAQTIQAKLVAELGGIVDIRVTGQTTGGVSIRTGGGALLVGPGAATLEYKRAGAVNAETAFDDVWIKEPGGQRRSLADTISSGEIKGLLELRDVEAPQTAERLAELMSHVADELNRAHNGNSSVPAPNTLTGRNVGQTLDTAVAGFSGQAFIAVTRADGVTQRSVKIDFVASGGFRINDLPASPAVHASNTFLAQLNTALGADGTAAFNNGVLSITATSSANGIAVAQGTPPSDKAGRGFSHYFGLNDLVSTDRVSQYDLGLQAGSAHGFTAGETLKFRFTGDGGGLVRDVEVAVPAGGTVGDMLTALNDMTTGAGRYGTFALDPATGSVTFTGRGSPPPRLNVLEDKTSQVPSGVSLTELFGIGGGVRASRADGFSIRSDISRDPSKLALAQFNLGAAAGTPALTSGDGRGALALADAGKRATTFQAAGGSPGGSLSVSRYASELSGEIGGKAATAKSRAESAAAIQTEATARQQAYEGVNLDEELVLLTTYQQAFNASARLIQAARDIYDILLGMV